MQQTIIKLKERIDKHYKELQRKYLLSKPTLKTIIDLINTNASNEKIYQWLEEHDNIIFAIEYNLTLIEQKNNYIKQN